MLYAIGHPYALVGLVVGFVIGVVVSGAVAGQANRLLAQRPEASPRSAIDPRRYLDPFGVVAAVLSGVGWSSSVGTLPYGRPNRVRLVAACLAGPLATLAVSIGLFAAYIRIGGPAEALPLIGMVQALHGHLFGPAGQQIVLGGAVATMGMALLSVVPLPPLAFGRLLFGLAPRTLAWQRAWYRLDDGHWGVAALLLLLLLPLSARGPLLLVLVDELAHPLLTALAPVL